MVIFHSKDVDKSVECSSYLRRELDRNNLVLSQFLLDGCQCHLPVSLVAVELVNCDYERNVVLISMAKQTSGAHFHTLLSINHENTILTYLESRDGTSDEIV